MKARKQLEIVNNLIGNGMTLDNPNLIGAVNKVSNMVDTGKKIAEKEKDRVTYEVTEEDMRQMEVIDRAQPVLVDAFERKNPDVNMKDIFVAAGKNIYNGPANVGGNLDNISKGLRDIYGDRYLNVDDVAGALSKAGWSEQEVEEWKMAKYQREVKRRQVAAQADKSVDVATQGEMDPDDPASYNFGWRSLLLPESYDPNKGDTPYSYLESMISNSDMYNPAPDEDKEFYSKGLVVDFLKQQQLSDKRLGGVFGLEK